MPSPSDFRKAFGLGVGQLLNDRWRIASSSFGHEVKEQNERYEFPAVIEVEWAQGSGVAGSSGSKGAAERRRELKATWALQTSERPIVYSAYGSPYECLFVRAPKFTPLDGEGHCFQITALGRAVRRRDVPTLKEARAAEREAAGGVAEVSKEEERRYLAGCRVIKSRFGTSKCGICGQPVDPGVKIAKRKGESGRGGWVHATCLVQQMKAQGRGSQEGRGGSRDAAVEAGSSGSSAESEEDAQQPPKRKRSRRASPPAGKWGRSGGSGSKEGTGHKTPAGRAGKYGKGSRGKGAAGGGAAAAAARPHVSTEHEE